MNPEKAILVLLAAMLLISGCAAPTTTAPTPEPAADEPASRAVREPLVLDDGVLYVALIWHQHQPVYFKDPETGVYERPWVRVHAAKDYVDMAAILREYPAVHAAFNLTPSLIRQLDDISGGARDLYWQAAETSS